MNRLRYGRNSISSRRLCAFLSMSMALAILPVSVQGVEKPGQPLEKIRIAYSGISGSQVPAWVAYEKGLFNKYGLDAQLIFIEGGSRAVESLISGDVAAAQVAGSSVLQSRLQGSGAVMVAGFLNTMDYQLVVSKDITRPDQLKHKTVAVSRTGSSSDFATRYALEKYGLEPNKDVTFLQIGSQPARFAALETGKIQGVMLAVPLTIQAKKMGYNILADLQMLGLEYQHTGLAVTEGLIRSRPELVEKILRAFVEAIHFYKTHRKESLEILGKYLKTDGPDELEETYEAIGLKLIPEKPYPTLKGIDIMLKEMAIKEPKAKTAKPEQFVDLTFVRELDRTGFIDRLYKTGPAAVARQEASPRQPPTSVTEKAGPAPAATRPVRPLLADKKAAAKPVPAEARSPSPPPSYPGGMQEHTVVAGDTLTRLAWRYYQDRATAKWMKIYEANRDTIKNPDYIYIGQKIVIPAEQRESS